MPKIITVTANTAIDYHIAVDTFALGDNLIAHSTLEFAAGKGVNVAKALESLAQQVTTLGFVGQPSRSLFDGLNSPLLKTDFTLISGKTRTNITLSTAHSDQVTHIRTAGYRVTAEDCQQLLRRVKTYTQAGDIVVLSGSLPPGASTVFYKSLIEQCQLQGALVFLDSSGAALKVALTAQPYLIKPNQYELEELMERTLTDEDAIIQAAQALIKQGIQCVVVSRGAKGALVVTKHAALMATVTGEFKPIASNIGCGDAMVGGLALATLQRYNLNATLKLAIACGTANLFTAEPGRFDKHELASINDQVVVRSL